MFLSPLSRLEKGKRTTDNSKAIVLEFSNYTSAYD
jgi:hypothetical protein